MTITPRSANSMIFCLLDIVLLVTVMLCHFLSLKNINLTRSIPSSIKAGPEPLDDELFLAIFEIEDTIEQQKFIEAARAKCREVKRLREFNNLLNVWKEKNAQNKRQQGSNKTKFTDGPLVLNCGDWIANDTGVYKNEMCQPYSMILHPVDRLQGFSPFLT